MARRTTKTAAAYTLPRMQITSEALPGVVIFSIASLTDGSLDAPIRQHAALASYKIHGDPWILRAELQDGCELADWEIDRVIATGVLPEIGIGWTAAMAADASRAVDAAETSLASLVTLAASVRKHTEETAPNRIAA
jgi:hypothetical protein